MSDLEEKFKQTLDEATKQIKEHLSKARDELHKAVAISEEKGIPFYAGVSFIRNYYVPNSVEQWLKQQQNSEIRDLLEDEGFYDPEYEGWKHSAVC